MQILSHLSNPSSLSRPVREEIRALERERQNDVAEEGLLHLSGRLERGGDDDNAAELYRLLAGQSRSFIADRARQRLAAMTGVSGGSARWEHLAGRFIQQVLDPAALAAMTVAGTVFRSARLAVLSRLTSSATPHILTRGLGARITASALATAAEAPVFTAASRSFNALLGRPQDWSRSGIWREFASGATLLGSLRLSGGIAGLGIRRWAQGPGALSALARLAIPQAGMLSGILLSHRLESAVGLRERAEGGFWLDAFATLLHFNVAGHLSQRLLGAAGQRREHALESRTELLHRWKTAVGAGLAVFFHPTAAQAAIHSFGSFSDSAPWVAVLAASMSAIWAMTRGPSRAMEDPQIRRAYEMILEDASIQPPLARPGGIGRGVRGMLSADQQLNLAEFLQEKLAELSAQEFSYRNNPDPGYLARMIPTVLQALPAETRMDFLRRLESPLANGHQHVRETALWVFAGMQKSLRGRDLSNYTGLVMDLLFRTEGGHSWWASNVLFRSVENMRVENRGAFMGRLAQFWNDQPDLIFDGDGFRRAIRQEGVDAFQWLPFLRDRLESALPRRRIEAGGVIFQLLVKGPNEEIASLMAQQLVDPNAHVRLAAVNNLGTLFFSHRIEDPWPWVWALAQRLADPKISVRSAARRILGDWTWFGERGEGRGWSLAEISQFSFRLLGRLEQGSSADRRVAAQALRIVLETASATHRRRLPDLLPDLSAALDRLRSHPDTEVQELVAGFAEMSLL